MLAGCRTINILRRPICRTIDYSDLPGSVN